MRRSQIAGEIYLFALVLVLIPIVVALMNSRPYIIEYVTVTIGGGIFLALSSFHAFKEKYAIAPALVERPSSVRYSSRHIGIIRYLHLSPRALGVISCGLIVVLGFIVPWYYLLPPDMGIPYPLPDRMSVILWIVAAMLALAGAIIYKWTPPTD